LENEKIVTFLYFEEFLSDKRATNSKSKNKRIIITPIQNNGFQIIAKIKQTMSKNINIKQISQPFSSCPPIPLDILSLLVL